MIEIIDKMLIMYTCIMCYLLGMFGDNSSFTQYYIIGFHSLLILDLTFGSIITNTLLIVLNPVAMILNFIFGDLSYLSIATMIISSNVFFYTIYKISKKLRVKHTPHIIENVVDPNMTLIENVVDPNIMLIDLTDS